MNRIRRIFANPIIKLIFKIISWIVLASLVFLASILIYYVITSKIYEIKGKSYEPAISLYTIISPSMEPAIKVYDVVITQRVDDTSNLKEGDVITYISSSTLGEGLTITHRIKNVIKTEDGLKFRTQGDNNSIADTALVSSDNILGKVIFKIPMLGRLQFLLQSKAGWLFLLLIPAMFIVLYDVIKVIRLSNLKQKVNESFKEDPSVQEIREKNEVLKDDLKKKFITIKAVKPIMSPVVLQEEDKDVVEEKNDSEILDVEPINNEVEEVNTKLQNTPVIIEQKQEVENYVDETKDYDNVLRQDLLSLQQRAMMLIQEQASEPMIEKVDSSEPIDESDDLGINKALLDFSEMNDYKKQFDVDKVLSNIENLESEEDLLPKIRKD